MKCMSTSLRKEVHTNKNKKLGIVYIREKEKKNLTCKKRKRIIQLKIIKREKENDSFFFNNYYKRRKSNFKILVNVFLNC